MQKFITLRETQNCNENTYSTFRSKLRYELNFKNFLKKQFDFPSDNVDEVYEFITNKFEMVKMIWNIPTIFHKYSLNSRLSLSFMKYCMPNEKILEIVVKSPFDFDTTNQKNELIIDYMIANYDVTDYIVLVVQ